MRYLLENNKVIGLTFLVLMWPKVCFTFYHAEVLNIWNVYNFSLGFIVMQELHFLLGSSCAMKRTLSSTSLDFVIMLRKSVF